MVGNRLKFLRKQLHMDQNKFSEILGVSRASLSHYETGKRDLSKEIITRLIEYTNCNINWLYTGQGEMFLDSPDHLPGKPPKNPKKDPEEQLAQLKKSVSDLEQRNTHLQAENQRLNRKLIGCLEELLFYHKTYPKPKDT